MGVRARCAEDEHNAPDAKNLKIVFVSRSFCRSIGDLPLGPNSLKMNISWFHQMVRKKGISVKL